MCYTGVMTMTHNHLSRTSSARPWTFPERVLLECLLLPGSVGHKLSADASSRTQMLVTWRWPGPSGAEEGAPAARGWTDGEGGG